jgi:putative lipase involved disintegration of autophagic bodies
MSACIERVRHEGRTVFGCYGAVFCKDKTADAYSADATLGDYCSPALEVIQGIIYQKNTNFPRPLSKSGAISVLL